MNEMISLFIDDEMGLDEKIVFVEEVRESSSFASETIELLRLEQQLRSDVVERLPSAAPAAPGTLQKLRIFFMQPLVWTSGALAAAVIALFLTALPFSGPVLNQNRFVIYKPDVNRVEITGTFTNWKPIPMRRAGDSGYWELNLALPQGEHYFSYILEGRQQLADPTIRARVPDDYGGFNSILAVGDQA